jgi:cell division protein FtsB
MSDDAMTKQEMEMQMLRLQLAQQGQGAISIAGIQKHWQILAAIVGFGVVLWVGGQKAAEYEGRLKKLEESPVKVLQLETDQRETKNRVEKLESSLKSLQDSTSNIEKSTKFTRDRVEEMVEKINRLDEKFKAKK